MHVHASRQRPKAIPPITRLKRLPTTNTYISYTSRDHQNDNKTSTLSPKFKIKERKIKVNRRVFGVIQVRRKKFSLSHPFLFQSTHLSFYPPQGRAKTKGGAENQNHILRWPEKQGRSPPVSLLPTTRQCLPGLFFHNYVLVSIEICPNR